MVNTRYYPIPKVGGAAPIGKPGPAQHTPRGTPGGFDSVLQTELDRSQAVKFSAHAQSRLRERGIGMTTEDQARLQEAVDRVDRKGSRESLVLFQDYALIVNVKNKTVVTAMDRQQMKEHVVTNIDSTVLA